ncbi:hypothetical protein DM860_010445 [Cuscuta australis]|uniref:Transcription repressor n=1 Tax=Cuscuta australis TaxID=267555 RepID=A0A328E1I0_9ASTE|nr:hypothetical protein DM860_010445 [Cuscuta australis]
MMKLIPSFLSKPSEPTPPQPPRADPATATATVDDDNDHLQCFASLEDDECVEKVIRGVKSSGRLFFEPGQSLISFQKPATTDGPFVVEESEALSLDSTDPFSDFKRSMEEMVAAHHHHHQDDQKHGLDWEFLEELLTCYLKINEKGNHGYIVGAFVDLLVTLSIHSSSSSSSSSSSAVASHSFTSPLSFCSSNGSAISPCLSSSAQEAEDEVQSSAGTV